MQIILCCTGAKRACRTAQGVAGHSELGDFARTFDASQRYSIDSMRSGTPPATPGAYGGNFGSLFAFSGPYGAPQSTAAPDLGGGNWGINPTPDVGGANPNPNPAVSS